MADTHHLHYHHHHHHLHRRRLPPNHHYNQKCHNYYRCHCMDGTIIAIFVALIMWQWFISPRFRLCSLCLNNRWTLLTAHVWRLLKCRLRRTEQLGGHGPCFGAGPRSSIIQPFQLSHIRPKALRPPRSHRSYTLALQWSNYKWTIAPVFLLKKKKNSVWHSRGLLHEA